MKIENKFGYTKKNKIKLKLYTKKKTKKTIIMING